MSELLLQKLGGQGRQVLKYPTFKKDAIGRQNVEMGVKVDQIAKGLDE
ncbi:MAG: hypothetical protein GY731_20450 [Gammaproteobacteria bacterium]|nr:hypothetical protein [Gammaproteobacteria bacterium]